jgi:hypothetical protein
MFLLISSSVLIMMIQIRKRRGNLRGASRRWIAHGVGHGSAGDALHVHVLQPVDPHALVRLRARAGLEVYHFIIITAAVTAITLRFY